MVDIRHHDAQVAIIGSMVISPEIVGDVISKVSEKDFDGEHRSIFIAIKSLFAENALIDPLTILNRAGAQYHDLIMDAMKNTPTAQNYLAYINLLKERSLVASARELGEALAAAAEADDVCEIIDAAGKLITGKVGRKFYTMGDLLSLFVESQSAKTEYLDWGIPKLNTSLYSEGGDFIVIGGRPSVGKTALAIEFAIKMAKTKKVGFFSFETGPNKFIDRVVSREFRIDLGKIKRRKLKELDFKQIYSCADAFCNMNVEFFHASGMTATDIQSTALARKYDVIFVDYLQIVNSGMPHALSTEQVRNISIGLHNLAQSNGITVVALAQLKRPQTSEGTEKAPSMVDLKESGQIEQDADVIMFLYREDPSKKNSPRRLKVAKNKEGECGAFTLEFEGKYQTFTASGTNLDEEDEEFEQAQLDEYNAGNDERRPGRFVPMDERYRGKKR